MHYTKHQLGVGLMEILVALLILALGVLGFIALQYRAVEATSEGSYRVQAINLSRDFAERIRVNRGVLDDYVDEIADADAQAEYSKNCSAEECSTGEMADYDVAQVVQRANSVGMTVNLLDCQGNSDDRKCIYVAWGNTAATDGQEDAGNCTTGTVYDPSSTCLIMEVY